MITALLFDLDDTLLGNDMGTFVPAYFQLLVEHLPPEINAQRFLAELVNGTRAMLANTDPARSLAAAFSQRFSPAMGWEPRAWQPYFDDFYRTHFPELRKLTQPRPAARAVMEWAFAQGYQVVIATSPVFPLAAVRERLRWAGIDDFPYALVTCYETSHFAKPHPEYLAEILAHLGCRPDEALLVGNDWNDDLAPAAALGLPHFWVAPAGSVAPAPVNGAHPVGVGELSTFLKWARTALNTVSVSPPPARALPRLLSGNLAAVVGALDGLPEPAWTQRPGEAEWSLTEVVCHLRDVEREVHHPRVRAVMESDNPFIVGLDTDPWASERGYQSQSGPQALQDFIAARRQTIALLAELPERAWSRPARHSMLGPTHLAEIVGWLVDHDRIHVAQLKTTRQKNGL